MRRDQAILGITRGVTPFSEGSFVSSLLQFQLHDTLLLSLHLQVPPRGFRCRLDRHRRDRAQKLGGDRNIDPSTAEDETS